MKRIVLVESWINLVLDFGNVFLEELEVDVELVELIEDVLTDGIYLFDGLIGFTKIFHKLKTMNLLEFWNNLL